MSQLLMFFLAFYQLQILIQSELLNSPTKQNFNIEAQNDFNPILPPELIESSVENDIINGLPLIKMGQDQTEVAFQEPIKSVNIDYTKNAIVLKFHKQHLQHDQDDKFLTGTDFMRFGKRSFNLEALPSENSLTQNEQEGGSNKGERLERSPENSLNNGNVGLRDARGDNFMRFGRDPGDFMRLGRNPGQDFMRFGRNPGQDFMRFGRSPGQDFMRFGRNPGQDFMRFGRSSGADFMRFGRVPGQDFMRFGRSPGQDFMRFGRSPGQDFLRFGRDPADFMRLGRSYPKLTRSTDKNFMRLGRPDNFIRFGRSQSEPPTDRSSNFMRLGRSGKDLIPTVDRDSNHTSAAKEQKNELKAVAKMIHDSRQNSDESNPMDKAIQVLFDRQNSEVDETAKSEAENDAREAQDYRR